MCAGPLSVLSLNNCTLPIVDHKKDVAVQPTKISYVHGLTLLNWVILK